MRNCITKALLSCLLSSALVSCAGQQQNANEPTTPEPASTGAAPEQAPQGPGVQAEMQFEDKGEPEQRADRAPPPTPAYKPTSKGKSANAQ